jgi:hypothetical protein
MSRTQFAGDAQGHVFAETAFKLVRDGFLKAWSVGFIPLKSVPRTDLTTAEKLKFTDPVVHVSQELMEYSLVPVPSNPNALSNAARRDFERLLSLAERNNVPLVPNAGALALGIELRKIIERHLPHTNSSGDTGSIAARGRPRDFPRLPARPESTCALKARSVRPR